jgi:tetratricopeptide (TPR) repeat protein
MSDEIHQAAEVFQEAYRCQMKGDLDEAITLYQRSLALHPTAEAHTFLGWTYSHQGRLDEAIEECKRAIEVDPEFGNPYNDIGAYLIELGQPDEAIPWLDGALKARRYESYHFAHFNLGRIWEEKGESERAKICYRRALNCEPGYTLAGEALAELISRLN